MNLVGFIKHLSVFKDMMKSHISETVTSKYLALVKLSGSLISLCKLAN